MRSSPVLLDLGSDSFQRLVSQVAGCPCTVSFDRPQGRQSVRARFGTNRGFGLVLRFGAPLPVVPAQVLVEVPERQLTFEATVQPVVGESEIRLSYPLWLVGPRECCGKVAKVDLHLRYAESGTARWHSGRSVEIADQAVSFLGEDQLAEGTRVDLLIRVSLQPLPMHAIGRVLRSVPTSLGTMIDVLPVACSFQTEHAVASALGRPLLPNRLAEEGECQCGVISPRMFSLIY